jgi:hypothetical protein
MVYNPQVYWVFGLRPSSGVSETGSVSVLRYGVTDTYSVGYVRKI